MLENEITRENLNRLVLGFYAKVVKDDLIGPIFVDLLGEDLQSEKWQAHIQLLTDFWASVGLGDASYTSSPFTPHIKFRDRLSIQAFDQWMKLFFETLNTIYEPKLAQLFLARAKNFADNFIGNLKLT